MQTVTSTDMQRNFASIFSRLSEPVVVMRDSRPGAVFVDYQEFMDMKKRDQKSRDEEIFRLLDKIHAKNAHIPAKQVERDVDEALKYVRSRRRH